MASNNAVTRLVAIAALSTLSAVLLFVLAQRGSPIQTALGASTPPRVADNTTVASSADPGVLVTPVTATDSLVTPPPTTSPSDSPPPWTAADVPLPRFAEASAGDVADTTLTPAEALDDARNLVSSPVIGADPVVRFLDIQIDATGMQPAWVIVSGGLPMQPQYGPVSASQRTFLATYGWAVVSSDGTKLLAEVLQSYTEQATPPPLPAN